MVKETGIKKLVRDILNTPSSLIKEYVVAKKIRKYSLELLELDYILQEARNEYTAYPNEDSEQEYREALEDLETFVGTKLTSYMKEIKARLYTHG